MPVMLSGYSSETLDGQALRKAVATLANWLVDGRIKAPTYTVMPLAEAAGAHALMERKGFTGRLLLAP